MATPLILREGQPARLVELPRPVADALSAAGVVKVAMTERSGWWEVTPGTSIGVVNVGGQQVVIEPKIDINRLVFLMGYDSAPLSGGLSRDPRCHASPSVMAAMGSLSRSG